MADLVSSFLGIYQVGADRAVAQANNRISEANAAAGNKVRVAKNAYEAARLNVARYMQSVNNNRVLDDGGHSLEATMVNFRRHADNEMMGDFSSQVRSAEQAGHAAASQAYAGVDGNVVDMVNGSTALRDSIVRQHTKDIMGMEAYDTTRRAGSIMSQMVGGLDNSLLLDTFDNNVDYAHKQAIPSYGPAVIDFVVRAVKAVATWGLSEATSNGEVNKQNSGTKPQAAFRFNSARDSQSYNINGGTETSDWGG